MKKLANIIGVSCMISLMYGCTTTPTVSSIVTPLSLQTVVEDGTFAALTKYPQTMPAFEAVYVGITNATAGGTLNLGTSTISSTLNSLGFGGLANQPGAMLLMDNLTPLIAQLDTQLGTNNPANNTNMIPYINAVASGMERGIQLIKQ